MTNSLSIWPRSDFEPWSPSDPSEPVSSSPALSPVTPPTPTITVISPSQASDAKTLEKGLTSSVVITAVLAILFAVLRIVLLKYKPKPKKSSSSLSPKVNEGSVNNESTVDLLKEEVAEFDHQ